MANGTVAMDHFLYEGEPIRAPWSSRFVVKRVLARFRDPDYSSLGTFLGVLAENREQPGWDWPDRDCLLWVREDGDGDGGGGGGGGGGDLGIWHEFHQRPVATSGGLALCVERIVGYHESDSGESYVGVKWRDCPVPTWESEEDLASCGEEILEYIVTRQQQQQQQSSLD